MKYDCENLSFKSSCGLATIRGKMYVPKGEVKGIVQIVHGMCDYTTRYDEFMKYLAKIGYVAVGADLLGHGETASSPDQLGFFAPLNGYKYLIRDVYRLNRIVTKQFPDKAYFLMGHSMGSFISRIYASKYAETIDGLILSGTSGPVRLVDTGIILSEKTMAKYGPHYRSRKLDALVSKIYNRRYTNVETGKEWLMRERGEMNSYINDPKCNYIFTSSAFVDLFKLHKYCNAPIWYKTIPRDLPILMFSGDMDPVGDFGKGVKRVYDKLLSYEFSDITLLLYPEGRHEMLHEINRYQVFMDIRKWLDETKYIHNI